MSDIISSTEIKKASNLREQTQTGQRDEAQQVKLTANCTWCRGPVMQGFKPTRGAEQRRNCCSCHKVYQLKVSVNPLLPPPADVELTGRMTESSLRHEPTEVTDRAYRCSAHMIPVNWGLAGKDWEGSRRLLVCQHYKLVVLLSADSSTPHTAAVCVAELFASYAQRR